MDDKKEMLVYIVSILVTILLDRGDRVTDASESISIVLDDVILVIDVENFGVAQ